MKRETLIQAEVRAVLCAGDSPVRVWRNNVGELPSPDGRTYIKYGLAPGSADLIGLIVGSGRFLAVEVKTFRSGSKQSDEQIAWQKACESLGGVYIVLRSADEAKKFVQDVKEGRYNVA